MSTGSALGCVLCVLGFGLISAHSLNQEVHVMHQYERGNTPSNHDHKQDKWTSQNTKASEASANNTQTVHVIFMNHLDVGYNGQIAPGFVNFILNQYFQVFFPRAVFLGQELKLQGYKETFAYMTHPWLVSMFLDCPPNLVLSGIKLQCPTEPQIKLFKEGVANGYITWHAAPMNMLTESMPQWLVERGLNISAEIDARLNVSRKMKVMSQRDVPGLTHAIIPTLLKTGITAISVGVNALSSPPDVPRLFRWQYDGQEILAAWHPGGYPDNPGPDPANPGGLSRKDCLIQDGLSDVLCFAFRTDDTGPPESIQEIMNNYEILRTEFPGAHIKASTFENFFAKVEPIRANLPVVTSEIGDTWIQGGGTDPRKTAEYWTTARVLGDCLKQGTCSMSDKRVWNASRILVKLGEHTWGLDTANDSIHWANSQFHPIQHRQNFKNCTNSWLEQRNFTHLAIEALADHKVVNVIKTEIGKLKATRPDLKDYNQVTGDPICSTKDFMLKIGKNGAISSLVQSNRKVWADNSWGHSLGQILYVTYNEKDFNYTGAKYNYIPGVGPGYSKSNITMNAHPLSHVWPITQTAAYILQGAANTTSCDVWVHLETIDHAPREYYGAPRDFWVHYVSGQNADSLDVDIDVAWFDKTTTRLPEAVFFSFSPATTCTGRDSCRWRFSKIGHSIDPLNVLLNGSQYQHGVDDDGVTLIDQSNGRLQIRSRDLQLVCPITDEMTYPTVFPAPLSPITGNITGIAFNLYNNIWDTNFIFWYPYIREDKDFKSRFNIHIS